jgi:hypothetical protein
VVLDGLHQQRVGQAVAAGDAEGARQARVRIGGRKDVDVEIPELGQARYMSELIALSAKLS